MTGTVGPCSDLTLTGAVFYSVAKTGRLDLIVLPREADAAEGRSAEAVARGYRYAGVIAVTQGGPRVEIKPGCAEVVVAAGYVFAGLLGPIFGAAAFAGVMAFQNGTDGVPGIGNRDTVPAMLTPGEGVVPGGVMDELRNMVRRGGMGGGYAPVLHFKPVYHLQAMDSEGMEKVLTKHNDVIQKHVHNELRKMNR
jgi:hypothetical protein